MMFGKYTRPATAIVLALVPIMAAAQTATDDFQVRITIAAECEILVANDLDFGSTGVIDAAVDAATTMQVICTNSTPYTVGMNAGTGTGATTTLRQMTSGGATLGYRLFRDAARTANWGSTGAETLAGTGTGSAQTINIYGRVPVQTTPAPGAYTDTVTVTVTY